MLFLFLCRLDVGSRRLIFTDILGDAGKPSLPQRIAGRFDRSGGGVKRACCRKGNIVESLGGCEREDGVVWGEMLGNCLEVNGDSS